MTKESIQFSVLTPEGATCGGIAVPLGQAREFLRCWAGALDLSKYEVAVAGERGLSQARRENAAKALLTKAFQALAPKPAKAGV